MYKNLNLRLGLIVAVIVVACLLAFPLNNKINLGLDLKGGMHLVMRVDDSKLSEESKKDAVDRAVEVIRNRIDQFGVKEPLIQRQGQNEIVIQLPGVTERGRAIELIGRTALLEFKLVNNDKENLRLALAGQVPEGFELKYANEEAILVEKNAVLTGDALVDATVRFDQSRFNEPLVSLKFNSKGAAEFAQITTNNVGKRLAIVLDGKVQSAPRINEPIPSGEAVITGRFTPQEAQDLAIVLRIGALPAPISIEEERTVGPLLGQDSIRSGVKAAVIGTSLVLLFMVIYYLFAGLIANIALVLNLLIILAGLSLFHSTLTLPGIAGIVLTLGMAVDANVLINERIREELHLGRSLAAAIANGYHKALSAIVDSNLTTIVAALFLFQFGTGPIRGFAVTLILGLLASMYTAVIVTHTIFEFLLKHNMLKSIPMLQFFKQTKIDFMAYRYVFITLSIIVTFAGLLLFGFKAHKSFGIDFSGGYLQEYKFNSAPSVDKIRLALKEVGLGSAVIQQFKGNPNQVVVRTQEESIEKVSGKFKEVFPDNKFEMIRTEKVGPVAGKILQRKSIIAVILSIVGILFYIWIRFKRFDFAFSGVVGIIHDIIMALALTIMTGRSIDLLTITALLTIAGYSINDTIVIYDRAREIMRTMRKLTLHDVINLSLNQCLSRTVLTTGATLLVVIALLLLGGEVLNGLAFCLMVGFVSGVYSTVFICSPIVLMLNKTRK